MWVWVSIDIDARIAKKARLTIHGLILDKMMSASELSLEYRAVAWNGL